MSTQHKNTSSWGTFLSLLVVCSLAATGFANGKQTGSVRPSRSLQSVADQGTLVSDGDVTENSVVATLALMPSNTCLQSGQSVTITVRMSNLGTFQAAGFQAFLSYNPATLSFVGGSYTAAPFGLHLLDPIVAVGGNIDLAAGINQLAGQTPTSLDADLATLTFSALTNDCVGTAVSFRVNDPPTGVTDTLGAAAPGLATIDSPNVASDITAPVITCPANAAAECDGPTDPGTTGVATVVDNCDLSPTVSSSDSVAAGTCPQGSVITRTWTATDACGTSSSCMQTITVSDTTAPVLTLPADASIECNTDSTPTTTGTASAVDNCDGSPVVTFTDSSVPGVCTGSSVITRTWVATDACGNSSSGAQTITLSDTTPPTLTPPAAISIECSADNSPAGTGGATASDNCDPAPVITFSDSTAPGACANNSVITRTWTATDACGNSTNATQIITLSDTTAPVLTLPPNTTIECDADSSPTTTGTASASDNCDAAPVVTFSDSTVAGACAGSSVITRTWVATDACGNSSSMAQTITLSDTTPPALTLPADAAIECSADSSPTGTGSATATDNCDAAPVITFADTSVAGLCANDSVITRTWTATDACGNASSAAQTITLTDSTPPALTLPADTAIECDADSTPTGTGSATASDNCDAAPVITFADATTPGLCANELTITRTWTATDACGNSLSGAQMINVVDTTAPSLTLPGNVTIECDADSTPAGTGSPTSIDNCDASPVVAFSDTVVPGACPDNSAITRAWTSTDACNNSVGGSQIITIADATPPIVTCPSDITLNADAGGCDAVVSPGVATASDNCDGAPTIVGTRSDLLLLTDPYASGATTITWRATDRCGNFSECTQTITVAPVNDLLLDVSYAPNIDTPLTRCITFELFDCMTGIPVTVEQEVTFTNGLATGVSLLPTCGAYDCVTARDALHSLRRVDADDFGIVGTAYVADFTDRTGMGGADDSLISGNFNDDPFVDIFDFGVFTGEWNATYGTGDTTCATAAPHADASGNGTVFTEDFTFIQINFLAGEDLSCCGLAAESGGPVAEISVRELRNLGLEHLAVGDLNGDGLLNADDIAAFAAGARPAPQKPGSLNDGSNR